MPSVCTPIPGPRSLALAERLGRVESPDTTFLSSDFPIFWDSALGANVTDADGNIYIDMNAGFGAAAIGHSHPRLVKTLREQSGRLIHAMGDVHPTEVKLRLAEELARLAPGEGRWKTIFGVTGADAIEAALKTAAIATGRAGLLAFEGGYHGLSLGALGATAWPRFREGLAGILGPEAVLAPFPGRRTERPDSSDAKTALAAAAGRLAEAEARGSPIGAVLVEPVLGRGGIVTPPEGFLTGLRGLCDRFGALLIADEIYTGLGRTGVRFACDREHIAPDLITIGKALGGGMPISVCLGRAEIVDAWGPSTGEARHTSTFLGHPLACAASLTVLSVIDEEGLVELAAEKGRRFRGRLVSALADEPSVAEIRARGLMIGIEIVDPESAKPDRARAWSVVVESLRRGVILLTSGIEGNVVSLTPPLTVTEAQMDCAAEIIVEALKSSGPL